MKKALRKDFIREIKKNKGRFLSIFFIVMLGAAFFAGVRSAGGDMKETADEFYKRSKMMDIRVVGTYGITEDDLTDMRKIEGVDSVTGGYTKEVIVDGDSDQFVLKLIAETSGVNEVILTSGRMPENPDECVLDSALTDYRIGDEIEVFAGTDEDLGDTLNTTKYTVTGFGNLPYYLDLTRGVGTIGNGSIKGFAVVKPEVFDLDVYTESYIRVTGADEFNSYSDEYEELVDDVSDEIESIENVINTRRYDSIKEEAQQKIDEAETELNDAQKELDDARAELLDAKEELDDGKKKLDDAKKELEDAKSELDDGELELKDAKSELDDGKEQLDAAQLQLDDAKKELDQGQSELAEAKAEIQRGEAELQTNSRKLEDAKKELEQGKKQLDEGKKQLQEGKKTLDANKAELESKRKELDAARAEMNKNQQLLNQGWAEYNKGKSVYDEQAEKLDEGKSQLQTLQQQSLDVKSELEKNAALLVQQQSELETLYEELETSEDKEEIEKKISALQQEISATQMLIAGLKETSDTLDSAITVVSAQIEAGQSELDAAKAQLDSSYAQLSRNQAALDAGFAQLDEAEKLLKEGEAQLDAGYIEYEKNEKLYRESAAAYEKGKKQYEDGLKQYLSGVQKLEAGKKEYEAGVLKFEDGKRQYEEGKAKFEDSKKEYEEGLKEYEEGLAKWLDGKKEYEDGLAEYEKAAAEYDDGLKEYEDGLAEYEDALAENMPKIEDGWQEVNDAKADLRRMEKPKLYALDRSMISSVASLNQDAQRMDTLGNIFPVIFFLVAALVSLTAMTRMVDEQRQQIGTLKALGYSSAAITMYYLAYALIPSLAGGIIGIFVGEYVIPKVIVDSYRIMYTSLDKTLIPFNALQGLIAVIVSSGCTSVAAWLACNKKLRSKAAALMRPEAPASGRRVFLEYITPLWKRMNFTAKSTARNLFRYKKRLFMTIIGIGACMGLIIVGFGLYDSITDVAKRQYREIFMQDATVGIESDVSVKEVRNLKSYIENMDDITACMELAQISATLYKDDLSRTANIYVPEDIDQTKDFLRFKDRISGKSYEYPPEGVGLSEKTAAMLGAKTGDTILVQKGDSGKKAEATVSVIVENYVQHYCFMSKETYQELFGEEVDFNSILINYEDTSPENESRLGRLLVNQEACSGVSFTTDLQKQIDNMLSTLTKVIWVLLIAAGLLAFVVLYNLNNINITERKRELATLKVLGFHDMEVAMYVYRENIFLTALGIVLGCFIGIILHRFTILTVEVDLMMFGRTVRFDSFIWSALITIVFSVIVNVAMFFSLKKINMIESLKSIE